jgi:acetylornithine/N-succinyldiaminopimelate aminotransferase
MLKNFSHILRCSGCDTYKTDIVKAEGCCLEDSHEKKYIDFESGVWCMLLGYNHPRINDIIIKQLQTKALTWAIAMKITI